MPQNELGNYNFLITECIDSQYSESSRVLTFLRFQQTPFMPINHWATSVVSTLNENGQQHEKHDTVPDLLVFGGGANCFSFGTYMNSLVVRLKLENCSITNSS